MSDILIALAIMGGSFLFVASFILLVTWTEHMEERKAVEVAMAYAESNAARNWEMCEKIAVWHNEGLPQRTLTR